MKFVLIMYLDLTINYSHSAGLPKFLNTNYYVLAQPWTLFYIESFIYIHVLINLLQKPYFTNTINIEEFIQWRFKQKSIQIYRASQ